MNELTRLAHTRPGFATYPVSAPGSPLSPHRPVPRSVLPEPIPTDCADPDRCDWCSSRPQILSVAGDPAADEVELVESTEPSQEAK